MPSNSRDREPFAYSPDAFRETLREVLGPRTILAALAFWDYAERSARYIFGDATGDLVADQIPEALRAAGKDGMTRTEISNHFARNRSSDRIARALADLLKLGRVRREEEETGGRVAERWVAK